MPSHPGSDVILLANLPFYTYAALALQETGRLRRYIFASGVTRGNRNLVHRLPAGLRRRLQTRDLTGLPSDRVTSLWWPELIQRGLLAANLVSSPRSEWLGAHLFDLAAGRYLDKCRLLHFVNGIGLHSAITAKRNGAGVLCDNRAEHPDYQERLLKEEYAHLGLSFRTPFRLVRERLLQEYAVADYFIVPSQYAKQTYVDFGIEDQRIFVVPYGVDPEQFYAADSTGRPKYSDSPRDPFRIIFVGQLCVRKGIHYLIQAFKALDIRYKELLLVGDFTDDGYRSHIDGLIEGDKTIRHVGHMPKVDLVRYYNNASVFVLPSLADSFGLVTLEAMACGLPVIVTEGCGCKELIREGVHGFVIPTQDVGSLVDRLDCLGRDSGLRRRMGRSACKQAQKHSWRVYMSRLTEVYSHLLGSPAREERV